MAKQALDDPSAKIPILVRLKDYKVPSDEYSGILHLIRKDLKSWGLFLELEQIERYLFQERIFLLLVDGLNELSASQDAQKDLRQFRDSCRKGQIPIVFVTRGLGYRDLGVETQLEIQPISPADRQRFLEERVSLGNRQKLQGWLERARQSDYTPFVMWMLATVCQQVNSSSQLESFSLGEAFREFVRLYQDRLYEEGRVSDDDCEEWASRLEYLASEMMTDERPENVVIPRVTAIEILGSEALLNNLIRHHLLVERRGKGEIEFCHQLLQEYYVAEWLRRRLPDFLKDENSGKRFQYDYLNYLKWTEPIAIMLGLPEITENQAIKIIELTLELNLMLGARLAGEVKLQFQKQTIELVSATKLFDEAEVSDWLRLELLGRTRSELALPQLRQFLKNSNLDIARKAAAWIGLSQEDAVLKLRELFREPPSFLYSSLEPRINDLQVKLDPKFSVEESLKILENSTDTNGISQASKLLFKAENIEAPSKLIQRLDCEQDAQIHEYIIDALGLFDTDEAVSALTSLIKSPDSSIREQAAKTLIKHERVSAIDELISLLDNPDWNIRWCAARVLGKFRSSAAVSILSEGLSGQHNRGIRRTAVEILGLIEHDEVIPRLLSSLQEDSDYAVRRSAAISLAQFNRQEAISELLKALRHYYPSDDFYATVEIPFQLNEDYIVSIHGMTHEMLNQLGDDESIRSWISEGNAISIREQVADALGRFDTQEVVNGLFESLRKGVKAAAVPLGKLGKQEVVPELIELLKGFSHISSNNKVIDTLVFLVSLGNFSIVSELLSILENINDYKHTDFYFRNRAAIVLAEIENEAMASYLPDLVKLLPTEVGEQASWAIAGIQARCGFYNYEIYQQAQEAENLGFENNFIRNFYEDLDKVIYRIQENPELRQNDQEERLTIDIVNQLCSLGYDAAHETKNGGHVDIFVRTSDFVWLGEAKIYRGNNYLWEGFQQLVTRYSSGDSNQANGGLLIYIFNEDTSSIMKNWQNYLLEKSLPDYSFRPCEMRSLAFISTHRHESSGQAFHVRHIPVMLHFAPKDKSGRRRKESP
ncbi:MAG TPA: HEAT repeat domain-containing protein [Leptolyngbyaceae cyanobacterium]